MAVSPATVAEEVAALRSKRGLHPPTQRQVRAGLGSAPPWAPRAGWVRLGSTAAPQALARLCCRPSGCSWGRAPGGRHGEATLAVVWAEVQPQDTHSFTALAPAPVRCTARNNLRYLSNRNEDCNDRKARREEKLAGR